MVTCLAVALGACGGPTNPYGAKKFTPHFPSFLPKASFANSSTDRVLVSTWTRPALSVDGVAVEAETPRWSVRIDVSGPVVPGEGLPYQGRATTCTWTVTLSAATATVPISLADFDSIDRLGHVYGMDHVVGQPPVPTSISRGQVVTFEMRAYELVGEGVMRWAPVDRKVVAQWDYEVEND